MSSSFAWWCVDAYAHFACGRSGDALSWAERTSRERPGYLPSRDDDCCQRRALAAEPESLEMSLSRLRQLDPISVFPILGSKCRFAAPRSSPG